MQDVMSIVFLKKWLLLAAFIVSAGLFMMGIQVLRVFNTGAGTGAAEARPLEWSVETSLLPEADVFSRPGEENLDRRAASLKLSGTIQLEGGARENGGVDFMALVDDEETGRQHLVSVGDALGPFRVRGIGREYLALGKDDRIWELEMTGTVRAWAGENRHGKNGDEEPPMTWDTMPALETTPYGKRVAENQWVIQREAVYAYTRSLIEDPARAIKLYESFTQAPPVDEDGLAGFRLQMRGEQDFFKAMGLADGMVIRAVNSMEMSNQGRAEYLVREFMRGDIGAVVLDVEQDGEMNKLIYVIR